jgi:Ser/Thr protein kinase RdoA (MazF antagonist)
VHDHGGGLGLAGAVAEAFGLGVAIGRLEPVGGGRSHLMWRLPTTSGVWAAKQLNRSREQWWVDAFETACAVELVAFEHGISMPRPVAPRDQAGSRLLADVPIDRDAEVAGAGGVHENERAAASFVVHEWCSGTALNDLDVPPEVLRWVGTTLAAIHSLPVGLDFAAAVQYGPHELSEWEEWLDDVPSAVSGDFISQVRDFLPDIAQAKKIADQGRLELGGELTPVFTHTDVKPDNVLLTPSTPVLVDWEGAGPDYAEWEAARTALAFSRVPGGWRRESFEQVLRAYRASGGQALPAAEGTFAGLLRGRLGAAAYLLWRALGHRPVSAPEQAVAHEHALEMLADLRASLSQLAQWVDWLERLG